MNRWRTRSYSPEPPHHPSPKSADVGASSRALRRCVGEPIPSVLSATRALSTVGGPSLVSRQSPLICHWRTQQVQIEGMCLTERACPMYVRDGLRQVLRQVMYRSDRASSLWPTLPIQPFSAIAKPSTAELVAALAPVWTKSQVPSYGNYNRNL